MLSISKAELIEALGIELPKTFRLSHTEGYGRFDVRRTLENGKNTWVSYESTGATSQRKKIIISANLNCHVKSELERRMLEALLGHEFELSFFQGKKGEVISEPITDKKTLWEKMFQLQPADKETVADALSDQGISANDYIILDDFKYNALLQKLAQIKKSDERPIANKLDLSFRARLDDMLRKLEVMDLDFANTEITIDPDFIKECLSQLQEVRGFNQIKKLHLMGGNTAADLYYVPKSVEELTLEECLLESHHDHCQIDFSGFKHLKRLSISNYCRNQFVIIKLTNLPLALEELVLSCKFIDQLNLSSFDNLKKVSIRNLSEGLEFSNYVFPENFEELEIVGGGSLPKFDLSRFKKLKKITLSGKFNDDLSGKLPECLETLSILRCDEHFVLKSNRLKSLKTLHIFRALDLETVDLYAADNLKVLSISHCDKLNSLNNLPKTLEHLTINSCIKITGFR